MPKAVIKAYASGTSAADAIISTIMPITGRLVGILIQIRTVVATAATENVQYEVSQQSTSQWAVNDAQGVIGYAGAGVSLATSGNIGYSSAFIPAFDLPVQAGARLYVHRNTSGAFSAATINVIWIIN